MKMECEKIKENVEEYLKNELTEKETDVIKKHLEVCGDCREFFSEFQKLKNSYPDYEKKFPYPRNLEEKLKKSLEDLEKIPSV